MDFDDFFSSFGVVITVVIGIASSILSFKKKRRKADNKRFDLEDMDWDESGSSPEAYVEIVGRREGIPAVRTAPSNVATLPTNTEVSEKEQGGGKEKIDARKMIIYSEIMKPKFDEGLK